jgi:hypothetical protein
VQTTRAVIISLLTSVPNQPRRALYQHSFPFSHKWGYLPDRDSPIVAFEERDIRQLYIEGTLEFVDDDRGRRCAVLAKPHTHAAALGALADTSTTRTPEASAAELQTRDEKIRRLTVGDGPTFDELAAEGKIGRGMPYRFSELAQIDVGDPVPPLVFIHVPRTAGTTVNKILMKNYKYRADSYGASFFPPYFPSQFLWLVSSPRSADDRNRPAFFTGHIDLGNEIFRHMPVRHLVITMLREPVERIISHYRFNSTQPSIFQKAIREQNLDVVGYLKYFGAAVPQQYELFAPASVGNDEERVARALGNLEASVSIFGLQERFNEFTPMLTTLIGLPDVSHKTLNKLPPGAADVTPEQIEQLQPLLKHDIDFYEGATKLYHQRRELMAKFVLSNPHPWTRFYA